MRIHVHDFAGHPFQVELSRTLAAHGDEVVHTYCDQYVSGKGALSRRDGDPDTLTIEPIHGGRRFDKYDPVTRILFELAYARDLWRAVTARPVDAVVMCNVPLIASFLVARRLRRRGITWLFWHQDVYSMGMRDEVARKLPKPVAGPVGAVFTAMEKFCVRTATSVVAIDEVFLERYREWGLDTGHVVVIPNWAPLDEIVPVARDNDWAREQRLPQAAFRLVYSGTLGRKHNPLLLLDLLRELVGRDVDAHLTVVSEGDGVEQLREHAGDDDRVTVLPFQPAGRLSEVLSSADVLVAVLEPEASRFSIPSKVLSYVSAGRPVIGLMPSENAAATAIGAAGGVAVPPGADGIETAAVWAAWMSRESARRAEIGRRSRTYAEREFDVAVVGRRFRQLMGDVAERVTQR